MAEVLARPDQENADIMQRSWLIERWCKHGWDSGVRLEPPTGRQLHLA